MKLFQSVVINFHTIDSYDWLDSIFCFLTRSYNIVSLSELENFYYRDNRLKSFCHITFDDGDSSFYHIVYPLLKKHRFPVSLYVSPKIIRERVNYWFQEIHNYNRNKLLSITERHINNIIPDKEKIPLEEVLKALPLNSILAIIDQYQTETATPAKQPINLTVDQLKELDASGLVTIGAHTMNHPILSNETVEECETEIRHSVEGLSNLLNKEVISFAYPNGVPNLDFGQREKNILKKNNIRIALSMENRPINKKGDPLSVPRIGIHYGGAEFFLLKLLSGKYWENIRRLFKGKTEIDYRKELHCLLDKK